MSEGGSTANSPAVLGNNRPKPAVAKSYSGGKVGAKLGSGSSPASPQKPIISKVISIHCDDNVDVPVSVTKKYSVLDLLRKVLNYRKSTDDAGIWRNLEVSHLTVFANTEHGNVLLSAEDEIQTFSEPLHIAGFLVRLRDFVADEASARFRSSTERCGSAEELQKLRSTWANVSYSATISNTAQQTIAVNSTVPPFSKPAGGAASASKASIAVKPSAPISKPAVSAPTAVKVGTPSIKVTVAKDAAPTPSVTLTTSANVAPTAAGTQKSKTQLKKDAKAAKAALAQNPATPSVSSTPIGVTVGSAVPAASTSSVSVKAAAAASTKPADSSSDDESDVESHRRLMKRRDSHDSDSEDDKKAKMPAPALKPNKDEVSRSNKKDAAVVNNKEKVNNTALAAATKGANKKMDPPKKPDPVVQVSGPPNTSRDSSAPLQSNSVPVPVVVSKIMNADAQAKRAASPVPVTLIPPPGSAAKQTTAPIVPKSALKSMDTKPAASSAIKSSSSSSSSSSDDDSDSGSDTKMSRPVVVKANAVAIPPKAPVATKPTPSVAKASPPVEPTSKSAQPSVSASKSSISSDSDSDTDESSDDGQRKRRKSGNGDPLATLVSRMPPKPVNTAPTSVAAATAAGAAVLQAAASDKKRRNARQVKDNSTIAHPTTPHSPISVSTVVPSFDTFAPEGLQQSPSRKSSHSSHGSASSVASAFSPSANKTAPVEALPSQESEVETQSQPLTQDVQDTSSPVRAGVRGSKRVAALKKTK